ncbi:unnamed protein product [Rotaria sp. Silwood2]|nr:unnamed protein product [Rotaria sp. Silwood2]CAF3266015.1 unnamed protein product [Rotaria sp. Silwood2]CAF4125999.1 unnamed protein product [Rotaria sp. Silwood2]CAF4373217.1 unnamed protein product [Rotaria sp. Silwood2]
MIASLSLVVLNLAIPILMIFTSFRNIVNFYLSSTALSSSLINCLYLFYLIQTFRSKILSEMNCRAIYYLQTSCIVILAYTIVAIHANFILCLFPSSSDQNDSNRTCFKSCGRCLRRFFRRFTLCCVLCVWSFSFTTTIPLLYSIDSNEKSPKPVYCPGTTQISYLEELFNRNRFIQTILFNLIPLLMNIFLSLIALLKLLYDCLVYLYSRLKMSNCSSCLKKPSSYQQQQQAMSKSMPLLSSLDAMDCNNIQCDINSVQIIETTAPTNELIVSSSNLTIQSCGYWLSKSFLRFLLVLSSCLLACIYPIVMRFYLIYFSVLVPLIFAVLNYSLGQLTSTQQQTIAENHTTSITIPSATSHTDTQNSVNMNITEALQTTTYIKRQIDNSSNEQFELQSPLIANLLNERDESFITLSNSSPTSTTLSTDHRSIIGEKQKYFSNRLYENTRNMFLRENN